MVLAVLGIDTVRVVDKPGEVASFLTQKEGVEEAFLSVLEAFEEKRIRFRPTSRAATDEDVNILREHTLLRPFLGEDKTVALGFSERLDVFLRIDGLAVG